MNINHRRAGIAALAIVIGVATAQAQALNVAASGAKTVRVSEKVGHSQSTWVSTAPLEEIRGTGEGVAGTITLDPRNVRTIRGTISVAVAQMKSGNEVRDGHLRGEAWLDAAKYPNITFTIASVADLKVSGNQVVGKATGAFTLHGVTKQMTVPFTLQYIDASNATRKRAPGDFVMVKTDFVIALADFNVQGSRGTVGSKVGETIKVSAQVFGSTAL